jgi:hypothetical protein
VELSHHKTRPKQLYKGEGQPTREKGTGWNEIGKLTERASPRSEHFKQEKQEEKKGTEQMAWKQFPRHSSSKWPPSARK